MSLTLEIPAEIEPQLRALATLRGSELPAFLLETATRAVYSVEAAARELHLATTALREMAASGALESLEVEGELFFVRDARFDALQILQAERLAGLQEITQLSEEMGLYDDELGEDGFVINPLIKP